MSDLCHARFSMEDGDYCICHKPARHRGQHECENCGWRWNR